MAKKIGRQKEFLLVKKVSKELVYLKGQRMTKRMLSEFFYVKWRFSPKKSEKRGASR